MNEIEKAIEYLKEPIGKPLEVHFQHQCFRYKAIKLAISALEKQKPKKPLEQRYVNYEIENELIGHCPACKLRWGVAYWQRYCSNCGQKLDWSWKND